MSAASPLLRVQDLSITHDGNEHPSPAHVSFDVHAGDVVLILGTSGVGKSTLALALNGLIPHGLPAEVTGQVEIAGLVAPEATPAELSPHIAMVFQDPDSQLVTSSVYDEVAFGPENLLASVDEVHARVAAALQAVGLWERRDDNPDDLSGGGRQRLAIACALAMESEVIVLDEPTANLDPAGITEVYAALEAVTANRDRAVILVEHNLDPALAFITRVVVLGDSGVLFDGTPTDVLRDHADELHALGVWLPDAAIAALHLRSLGAAMVPLPLTSAELAAALPPRDSLPAAVVPEPASGESVISVSGLTFTRSKKPVLHDVSLQIADGSFTAIVGSNGAGKTTLLQAMCGVLRPPRGTVTIAGVDATKASSRAIASRVGFVFQNPEHQFMTTSVFDELAYELRAQKRPAAEIDERVGDMLERFGLTDRANVHPFLLSGGQKRRLSVGTALLSGAKILALDEPTFGQDRARAHELLELLQQLREAGTTIIVVTHDMQLVADYATHTVVMADGRVVAQGPTRDVWAEPAAAASLQLPPVQRALRARADYADVWNLHDLGGTS